MKTSLKDDSIFLNGIGNIHIRLSRKAKHTRIIINPFCQISVVIPPHIRIEDAIEFVNSKKNWIKTNKAKVSKRKLLKLNLSDSVLEKFWKNTEKSILQLSLKFGLGYKNLVFKTLKSRWGSCSFDNTICINNLLYYLPKHLQEYVLMHELMHTKIKNHSKVFWNKLEKICKNSKLKRKELRDNYALG